MSQKFQRGDKLMELKRLSVGIDDFKDVIDRQCYYVDKTLLVKELAE
ncbi:hypothetical protein LQZ18_08700 [Lachnospiraceae bacterium ZAX-1]